MTLCTDDLCSTDDPDPCDPDPCAPGACDPWVSDPGLVTRNLWDTVPQTLVNLELVIPDARDPGGW